MALFDKKVKLNLALQGGGAHGAFTWGVLDRLLEDERIEIGWVSGTSAGAVNAVALASGLLGGGRQAGREKLQAIWQGVYKLGVPDLMRLNPFLYSLSRLPAVAQMASLLSPYEFNPLGFDPLRRLLSEHIDFEALQHADAPLELLISATDVATGRPRHFRREELRVESVLASACLPTLHHAVNIDGRAYWDGGFSANPELVSLAQDSPVNDTLIVQLNPTVISSLPTGVREISDHANTLTFNAPLLRDVEIIETARRSVSRTFQWLTGNAPVARLARHRFHLIEAGRYTGALKPGSKVQPDWAIFTYLNNAGRMEAGKWIEKNLPSVGRRSTVDFRTRYLSPWDAPTGARAAAPMSEDDAKATEQRPDAALPEEPRKTASAGGG